MDGAKKEIKNTTDKEERKDTTLMSDICNEFALQIVEGKDQEEVEDLLRMTSRKGQNSKIQDQADDTAMMNSIFKCKLEAPISRMSNRNLLFMPQNPDSIRNIRSKKEYEQNYIELFNKSCLMMLPKMPEILKVESLTCNEFKMTKFKTVFLSIPSKNKIGPLFVALNHTDIQQKGIYVYISTRQKYPSEESNEGSFYMTQVQKDVIRYKSIKG